MSSPSEIRVISAGQCTEIPNVCQQADLLINGEKASRYGFSPAFTPSRVFVAVQNGQLVGAALMEKDKLSDIAVLEGQCAETVGKRFHNVAAQANGGACTS